MRSVHQRAELAMHLMALGNSQEQARCLAAWRSSQGGGESSTCLLRDGWGSKPLAGCMKNKCHGSMVPRNVSDFSNILHLFNQTNRGTANCTYGYNEAVSEMFFRTKAAVAARKDPEWQTEEVKKRNLKVRMRQPHIRDSGSNPRLPHEWGDMSASICTRAWGQVHLPSSLLTSTKTFWPCPLVRKPCCTGVAECKRAVPRGPGHCTPNVLKAFYQYAAGLTRYTSLPVQPHIADVKAHRETLYQRHKKGGLATCPREDCSVHCSSAEGPPPLLRKSCAGMHLTTAWTGSGLSGDHFLPRFALLKKDQNLPLLITNRAVVTTPPNPISRAAEAFTNLSAWPHTPLKPLCTHVAHLGFFLWLQAHKCFVCQETWNMTTRTPGEVLEHQRGPGLRLVRNLVFLGVCNHPSPCRGSLLL